MYKGKRERLIIFSIVLLGLLVFSNSLLNGFVWDDEIQILNNPVVHKLSNITIFFTGSTFYGGTGEILVGMYYRPIMVTIFSFIYRLFGPAAFFYHWFS